MTEEKTAADEEKKKQEELEQEMTADDLAAEVNQNVPVTLFDKFHRGVNLLKFQKPIQLLDFKGLNVEKLEKYFLLLAALDENLSEYKDIKKDLQQIYDVVNDVNVFDALDESATDSAHSLPTGHDSSRVSALRFSQQKRATLMAKQSIRR